MKYGVLIAVILVVAVAAWFGRPRSQLANTDSPLAKMSRPDALPGFVFAGSDAKQDSIVHTFTNSESVLKIEVLEHVDAPDAQTLLQDGVMGIQALYANALSPYPGDISNKVTTDPTFQPRLFHTTNSSISYTYLLLYANERFGYGATTKDSIKYKSLVGWFYCGTRKEFFRVKLFTPIQTPDDTLKTILVSLRCV